MVGKEQRWGDQLDYYRACGKVKWLCIGFWQETEKNKVDISEIIEVKPKRPGTWLDLGGKKENDRDDFLIGYVRGTQITFTFFLQLLWVLRCLKITSYNKRKK